MKESEKQRIRLLANQSIINNGITSVALLVMSLSLMGCVLNWILLSYGVGSFMLANGIFAFVIAIACIVLIFKTSKQRMQTKRIMSELKEKTE